MARKPTEATESPIDINELKALEDIKPETHAGCYELVPKAIELYGKMKGPGHFTVADLDMIYYFTLVLVKTGFPKLRTAIGNSSLPDQSKESLRKCLSNVQGHLNRGEYDNNDVGIVGTAFYTFKKKNGPTDDDVTKLINILVKIWPEDSTEDIFNAAKDMPRIKGVKDNTLSAILHCLKPTVFPIWNKPSRKFFPRLPINPPLPENFKDEEFPQKYFEASKKLNNFRDYNNLPFKNWRVIDLLATRSGSTATENVQHLLVETTDSGPHNKTEEFSDLKNKFEQWLSKRLEHPSTIDRYVKIIEDLDGQDGVVVRLTGKKPPDPIGTVFKVRSLGDFQKRYSDILYLRTRKKNDEKNLKAVYSSCKQFEDIFNNLCEGGATPDSGFTKSALNKYIEFLDDPKNLVDDGSTSVGTDTKSPEPPKDQDNKLSEVFVKALSECEKVPEFQSVDPGAFLRERQKIWFGAPGTGKSFKVNELAKCLGNNGGRCFRTTFHPDYDYATFVGCYKPAPAKDNAKEITYEFVPQVFTKAYVAAWEYWMSEEPKPVVLVIEEINRGNCAQIFGQIFQLLDRDKFGFSEYPVTMDQDLLRYLLGLQDSKIKDASYEVDRKPVPLITQKKGDEKEEGVLVLPPNFFIFATMNTSDQSLFPMDSAFKRRWGWEYVPIDCSGDPGKWIIQITAKQQYNWKDFLEKINKKILEKLKSPDKQLGERFVKADENRNIDRKTFVNKVMFYLVGDAFKDDSTIRDIWRKGDGKKDGEKDGETEVVFADFADEAAGPAHLEHFFKGLDVKTIGVATPPPAVAPAKD